MAGILSVCDEGLASSDFRGNPNSAVVDARACVELNSRVSLTATYSYAYTYLSVWAMLTLWMDSSLR